MTPIPLSEALVKFLGTGESALARSDVVKRIWDYIKQNNLQVSNITNITLSFLYYGLFFFTEICRSVSHVVLLLIFLMKDPSDKRRILCDDKLKELFDVDTFTGFTVSKLLGPHFIKAEKWVLLVIKSMKFWLNCSSLTTSVITLVTCICYTENVENKNDYWQLFVFAQVLHECTLFYGRIV